MIIFACTRHVYDSYTDFWRLVELARFPIIFVDQVDLSASHIYVSTMVNSEWETLMQRSRRGPRNAHTILWNLERPIGWTKTLMGYNLKCHTMTDKRWFDEIWVSDRQLARESELRFVVLGSHPDLGQPGRIEDKKYDVVHMSVPTNRRQSIYKHLDQGQIGPNCWGEDRDRVLRESKFALNVHQDGHPWQEPLRFALFAAYGLPILTESIADSYPWSEEYMITDEYPHLVGHLAAMVANKYERWHKFGERARHRMTVDFEFGKMVRLAIRESAGQR